VRAALAFLGLLPLLALTVGVPCAASDQPRFPLLAGAENVRARVEAGEREWSFTLARPYPAQDVVEHYARHAARQGWHRCALDVRPWEPQPQRDGTRIHFLHARIWADGKNREAVMVVLRYIEPGDYTGGTPRRETLHVDVVIEPVGQGMDPCDVPPAQGRMP
jgi:hypothetical protein